MADPKRQEKTLAPLHDRLVLERVDQNKTEGGILLPDSLDVTHFACVVLSVGEAVSSVQAGDTVIVPADAGTKITSKISIVKLEDILAKVR